MLDAHRSHHQCCRHRSVLVNVHTFTLHRSFVVGYRSPYTVGGKFADDYVPERIRHLLIAESAANDGLAYPFLSISLYLTTEASRATAFGKWVVIGCLCAQSSYPHVVAPF